MHSAATAAHSDAGKQRPVDDLLLDVGAQFLGADAERPRQLRERRGKPARAVDPSREHVALLDRLAHEFAQSRVGGGRERRSERAPERAVARGRRIEQHGERRTIEQIEAAALVQHGEIGGRSCFEREALQQPGAKRMDGLDLQSARHFERRSEQLARPRTRCRIEAADADAAQALIERFVVERDPAGELSEHAVRHVRRRRLGEGEAEDFCRIDAVEQQPDHPLRQHMRLAGTGIGRDERGHGGVGGLRLHGRHRLGNVFARTGHQRLAKHLR